jgi:pimeloyl-ACP methyl ester carboxylesterase
LIETSMGSHTQDLFLPDGTRIAYSVAGSGPALVLTNGLTTSSCFWKYVLPIWSQRFTVVTWDLPGHGESAPAASPESATIEAQPTIIARVMEATGTPRAFQVGWSTGSQIVLETYRQLPALCQGLVMVLGSAGHALQTTRLPVSGDLIYRLVRATPPRAYAAFVRAFAYAARKPAALPLGRWLGLIGPRATPEDMLEVTEHIGRLDAPTLQRMACSSEEHSAHAVLAALEVPLLILAGDKDPFAPTELVGLPLSRAAHGSELVRLPGGTHTALLEEPELIARTIERFIEQSLAARPPESRETG